MLANIVTVLAGVWAGALRSVREERKLRQADSAFNEFLGVVEDQRAEGPPDRASVRSLNGIVGKGLGYTWPEAGEQNRGCNSTPERGQCQAGSGAARRPLLPRLGAAPSGSLVLGVGVNSRAPKTAPCRGMAGASGANDCGLE